MKQNCKIKDNSLELELKTVEPTRINKLGRTLVNLKQYFKRLVNVPDRVRVVKISNHLSGGAKKNLEKSIIVEHRYYKGKQTIRVKTDTPIKCLLPL